MIKSDRTLQKKVADRLEDNIMSKTVYGSILDATEDIICHQVNCQGGNGCWCRKGFMPALT